jgi:hypothetical protein
VLQRKREGMVAEALIYNGSILTAGAREVKCFGPKSSGLVGVGLVAGKSRDAG